VARTPSPGTLFRWQLRDQKGTVLSETISRPFFNGQDTGNWPPAPSSMMPIRFRCRREPPQAPISWQGRRCYRRMTEPDRCRARARPEGSNAGKYPPLSARQMWTSLEPVGAVELAKAVAEDSTASIPSQPLDIRFGDASASLDSAWRSIAGRSCRSPIAQQQQTQGHPGVHPQLARPGAIAGGLLRRHPSVDQSGEPLARDDEMAGSPFSPPTS